MFGRIRVLIVLTAALAGCASLDANVRKRAAADFSCKQDKIHVVDAYASVFRVAGCGLVATYRCADAPLLAAHCHRIVWDAPEVHEVTAAGAYSLSPRARAR
jgi:hypothetical protein